MRWGYNWDLGPFETWDALGFAETADAIEKAGHKLPDAIKKMKARGAAGFYKDAAERSDGLEWSFAKGRTTSSRSRTRATAPSCRCVKGGEPVLSNDGAEAWDLGDGVLGPHLQVEGEQHRPRQHLDDSTRPSSGPSATSRDGARQPG